MLIIRALNVAGRERQNSNSFTTELHEFQIFVRDFPLLISSYRPYTTTDDGRKVVASVLFHPVWKDLVVTVRQLPQSHRVNAMCGHLDILEILKRRHAFHNHVPLSFDWTSQLYPDSEQVQPTHVSVDMYTAEARIEETLSLPVTEGHPGLPQWGMDVVDLALDEEEAVEGRGIESVPDGVLKRDPTLDVDSGDAIHALDAQEGEGGTAEVSPFAPLPHSFVDTMDLGVRDEDSPPLPAGLYKELAKDPDFR